MVHAFVRLREHAPNLQGLVTGGALEEKTVALAMEHDTFSRNTHAQLKQVFDALRALNAPPGPPKRSSGFVVRKRGHETKQHPNYRKPEDCWLGN